MNPEETDTARLVERLKEDDTQAFDTLYRRYFRALVVYAARIVPYDKAEEAAQETMLALWEMRRSLVVRVSLRSLLFVSVRNRALNMAGSQATRSRVMQSLARRYEDLFEDPDFYLGNDLEERFLSALGNLPAEAREAFLMNRTDGLSHKEIAARLGVSPQTVNYRICQALRLLREELREYLPLLLLLLG